MPVSKTQLHWKKTQNFKALHANFSKSQYSPVVQELCRCRDLTESSFLGQGPASVTPQPIPLPGSCPSASRFVPTPSHPLRASLCLFQPNKREKTMLLRFAPAEAMVPSSYSSHCGVTEHLRTAAASDAQPAPAAPCASPSKASPSAKPAAGTNTPTRGADPRETSREG